MSIYQEMRRTAVENVEEGRHVGASEPGIAALLAGIIYALLAIAAAIADLKP